MARKLVMTWIPAQRRWIKKHRGKMYSVSCRQLGCAESKEASAAAANAWWEGRLREIEAAPPTEDELKANAFKVGSMVQDWKQLSQDDRERLVDSLVGEGQYRKIKTQAEDMVEATLKTTPPDRTVAAQVDAWKNLLKSACQSGQMSEGRFDAYCRNIRVFADYTGSQAPIDTIDETRLEGFFDYLSAKVGAGEYSSTYAHTLLMTAKQFVSRLAEMKLISMPGNIRSRRFRFNHSAPAKIETFSVEELRGLLNTAGEMSERTKLYLLLMLNCGMYQNDIAEMKSDEVNWKQGTLTRARSKTRGRNDPVVTYKLWPETFTLLKKHRATDELSLTTDEGNPLVKYWLEDGKMRRYDAIQSAWSRLAKKMGVGKHRLGMKHLRKTSASLLGQHPQFKFYANHFLADSPRSIAVRHYVIPSDQEFFRGLEWLRQRILNE